MRTTIDVPVHIRQKLAQEASCRNLKGFSSIITEALDQYFDSKSSGRKGIVDRLKGSLSGEEYAKAVKDLNEGRAHWRV